MEVTYLGLSSFKLKSKKTALVMDPFDPKMVGLPFPAQKADIVTVSHDHGDHNNISAIKGYHKLINAPGEYEVMGISVIGLPSYHDKERGRERGENTIFVFEAEHIRLAHLGDLGHELSDADVNRIGDIDVLMVPVGGVYTIDSNEAVNVVAKIEPKIVIPMHYRTKDLNSEIFGKLEGVEAFVNASGLKVKEEDKLVLDELKLPEDEQMIVLLN